MIHKAAMFLMILGLGLLLTPLWAFTQTTVAQFQVNGLLTDYFSCDDDGNCTIYSLEANTSGTFGLQYFFFYDVFVTNSSGQTTVYDGFGQIPPSSVSTIGATPSQVTLKVDTSQVSGFTNNVCTFDPSTGNSNCSPGTGGVVDLTWRQTRAFNRSASGTTRENLAPNFVINNNASATQSSANSTGTILGFSAIPNGDGDIGSGHDGTLTIQQQ